MTVPCTSVSRWSRPLVCSVVGVRPNSPPHITLPALKSASADPVPYVAYEAWQASQALEETAAGLPPPTKKSR